jgi:ketosteroid isomerase-like protein
VTSEEPTNPGLVEYVRGSIQAGNDRDIYRALTFYAPNAVWDMSPWGMGTFEGIEAIRGFFEDWLEEARAAAQRLAEERGVGDVAGEH